ncbi:hypothetical protein BH10CYA1_BH10CYA1_62700 [soil metagenome]
MAILTLVVQAQPENQWHAILQCNPPMMYDVFFFGMPLVLAFCLAVHAVREQNWSYWRPSFAFFAYCAFYLAGGRDVLLYLTVCVMMGGGALSAGWAGLPI